MTGDRVLAPVEGGQVEGEGQGGAVRQDEVAHLDQAL